MEHSPTLRASTALIAIAAVAAAYVAFRLLAHATALDAGWVKLVLWSAMPLLVVTLQHGGNWGAAVAALGIKPPFVRAMIPGILAMLAAGGTLFYLGARLPQTLPLAALVMSTLVGPFAEELLFRGFLVNRLIAAGIGAAPAIIVGGLAFGLAHLGNVWHANLSDIALEIGITAAGGMLFGWTLWRFGGSLWAAFAFHAGLNLPWDAFGIASTAIGGANGNIARAAGIAAGIVGVIVLSGRGRGA